MDKFQERFEEFKDFIPKYYSGNYGLSKYSEPYFRELIKKLAPQTNVDDRPFELKINLGNGFAPVNKSIDIKFETVNSIFLVDIKKNIDLVEKDLFKWYLMKTCEWKPTNYNNPNGKKYKKVELIWEEKKMSDDCQYLCLLEYAKRKKWIDGYFYLTTEESFIEELKGLEELINQN